MSVVHWWGIIWSQIGFIVLSQVGVQAATMEKLIGIDSDYWNTFLGQDEGEDLYRDSRCAFLISWISWSFWIFRQVPVSKHPRYPYIFHIQVDIVWPQIWQIIHKSQNFTWLFNRTPGTELGVTPRPSALTPVARTRADSRASKIFASPVLYWSLHIISMYSYFHHFWISWNTISLSYLPISLHPLTWTNEASKITFSVHHCLILNKVFACMFLFFKGKSLRRDCLSPN